MGARADHGAELGQEDLRALEREADGAQTERRVHLRGELEGARELVAADVERSQDDRARGDRLDDGAIELVLLLLVGLRRAIDVEELGPIKADPVGAVVEREDGLRRELDVRLQADRLLRRR